ncbi:hypothetical protein FA15DRAFT_665129 [Coprinopsis marcescibilis]|uniref:Uncharacterized protein n=1 Tax=Coprinopsis marcescibilis TaxID=230819 RepID=A0A5C3L7C2_COPMA|nr:hypothetical protein FA15DRAFT_665129 [Coprinopsis marcescibilis]
MQSSWRHLARETFRWQARIRPICAGRNTLFLRHSLRQASWVTNTKTTVLIPPFLTTKPLGRHLSWTAKLSKPLPESTPIPALTQQTTLEEWDESLEEYEDQDGPEPTKAQVAGAAAEAVRIAVSNGDLSEALLVLNSIYVANTRGQQLIKDYQRLILDKPVGLKELVEPLPIPFQPGTPIRLVAHSFLHGLLRYGYQAEAARVAEQFMRYGVRMHWKTLDAIFTEITKPLPPADRVDVTRLNQQLSSSNVLKWEIPRERTKHAGGTHALRLLAFARKSRQRRTRLMFKTLIALCIINGEIILASLIFGTMMRDWNAQVVELAPAKPKQVKKHPIHDRYDRVTAFPSESRMEEILGFIERALKVDDQWTEKYRASSLQALANLAVLLDRRLIPFEGVSPLIRLLTLAEALPGTVHVPDNTGKVSQVRASQYFQEVLDRLSYNLPWREYPRRATLYPPYKRNKGLTPALSLSSYNHLLRRAFLQRHSKEMGSKIFYHMTKNRFPVLRPSKETLDIYRQASIVLDDEKLWMVAARKGKRQEDAEGKLNTPERYAELMVNEKRRTDLIRKINFLVNIGRPDLVAEHLHSLIGRFAYAKTEEEEVLDQDWNVFLGPRFFVALLSALLRNGHTGNMRRVWRMAKDAEAQSWSSRNSMAWSLPIAAYSIMIDMYAKEVRKGQKAQYIGGKLVAPRVLQKPYATGWGAREYMKFILRGMLGFYKGMDLYQEAMAAIEHFPVKDERRRRKGGMFHPDHKLPIPDPAFFNSILDVVSRDPDMIARSGNQAYDESRENLTSAYMAYRQTGMLPKRTRKELLRIGNDMVKYGLPIPPALTPYFVGHGFEFETLESGLKTWQRTCRSQYRLRARINKWAAYKKISVRIGRSWRETLKVPWVIQRHGPLFGQEKYWRPRYRYNPPPLYGRALKSFRAMPQSLGETDIGDQDADAGDQETDTADQETYPDDHEAYPDDQEPCSYDHEAYPDGQETYLSDQETYPVTQETFWRPRDRYR